MMGTKLLFWLSSACSPVRMVGLQTLWIHVSNQSRQKCNPDFAYFNELFMNPGGNNLG